MLDESAVQGTTGSATMISRRKRATRASAELERAHIQLSGISTLRLTQCAFANEVRGFGQFTPASTAFRPGQQVLIYCEVENYSVRHYDYSGQIQHVAELQGRYSIIDSNNRVVYQHQYQPVRDSAQRRRKDFYMFFPVTIPQMGPGQYRLQLSVEDLVGNKVARCQEDMFFNVSSTAGPRTQAKVANSQPEYDFNAPFATTKKSRLRSNPDRSGYPTGIPPVTANNNQPRPANGTPPLPAYRR